MYFAPLSASLNSLLCLSGMDVFPLGGVELSEGSAISANVSNQFVGYDMRVQQVSNGIPGRGFQNVHSSDDTNPMAREALL